MDKGTINRNNQGFSLIELVIVIVVLSILGAIVIPYFDSLRKKAMIEVVKANLREITKSCLIYEITKNRTGARLLDLGYTNLTSSFSDNGGLNLGSPGYPYYFHNLDMVEPLEIYDGCSSITARSKYFPNTTKGVLPHFQIYFNYGTQRFDTLCVVDSEKTFNNGTCDIPRYVNGLSKKNMW